MTNAVDKREWLIAKGLAKPGRGKFSNAAKEALAEAEKHGIAFVDKKAIVGPVKTVIDGEIVEERREVNPFAHHAPAIREGYYTFTGKDGFTMQVNASEACNTCTFSLGWCYCSTPTFVYWKTGEVLSYGNDE